MKLNSTAMADLTSTVLIKTRDQPLLKSMLALIDTVAYLASKGAKRHPELSDQVMKTLHTRLNESFKKLSKGK